MRTETERLVLREWRDEDAAPFVQHTNTPAVMQWLGGVMEDEHCECLLDRLRDWETELGHTFWVVERKADGGHLAGELLGFCGLKHVDLPGGPEGDCEIGWRLREDAWGKGYAREAAEASLSLAFETYDAPHVVALTVSGNANSWGLMERLGMARRADMDFDLEASGRFPEETIIVYKLTRQEWEETQG